jgi:hypothetical protein
VTAEPDVAEAGGRFPTRGWVRVLRVGVLGGVSLALATAAHLGGGGRLPSAGLLIVVGLLLGLSAVTLTARRCRFRLLLPALAVQQALLHLLFEVSAEASACGLGHGAGMVHPAGTLSCGPITAMPSMNGPSWSMWAAHLTATLVTAWVLARGETWLWRSAQRILQAANAAPVARCIPRNDSEIARPPAGLGSSAVRSPAVPRAPPMAVDLL